MDINALKMTALPCPRCLPLARKDEIRVEMVQPLPNGTLAPLARDGSGKCCYDCAAADGITSAGISFVAARIAVGNDRQYQYRLPGVPMGLVQAGRMRRSEPGDLEKHHAWLNENNWFDCED